MPVQEDLTDTLERGRDELIRLMAEQQIVPAVVEGSGDSSLPGMSASPTFRLDSEAGASNVVDRQTTIQVVEVLGLETEADCEAVREEIRTHDAWGGA